MRWLLAAALAMVLAMAPSFGKLVAEHQAAAAHTFWSAPPAAPPAAEGEEGWDCEAVSDGRSRCARSPSSPLQTSFPHVRRRLCSLDRAACQHAPSASRPRLAQRFLRDAANAGHPATLLLLPVTTGLLPSPFPARSRRTLLALAPPSDGLLLCWAYPDREGGGRLPRRKHRRSERRLWKEAKRQAARAVQVEVLILMGRQLGLSAAPGGNLASWRLQVLLLPKQQPCCSKHHSQMRGETLAFYSLQFLSRAKKTVEPKYRGQVSSSWGKEGGLYVKEEPDNG
mmetsp:Transcript_35261/g.75109  ORF Transcript_35261/g.75109 Transcript_35261/m.75109 type:complete len:283 (-) Transcript_35261:58-906(-)